MSRQVPTTMAGQSRSLLTMQTSSGFSRLNMVVGAGRVAPLLMVNGPGASVPLRERLAPA